MADESRRIAGLSADKLRRLMSRLTEQQGTAEAIPRAPRGGALPVSFAQERLWFLDRLGAGGAVYHVPASVGLSGPLDALALERTLNALIARHEALRTAFSEADGRPVQTVLAGVELALPRLGLSALPEDFRAGELARITRDEASRPFDLARAPLLRAALVRLGPEEHRLALTFHHIVTDGWSLGVLIREVAALYPGFASGAQASLPELPIQPADYAVWERQREEAYENDLAFWRERLAGLPPLALPADRPRPAAPSFRGGLATLDLPPDTVRALEALAQRERATPFMALLALFEALLLRYTGQSDFGVGTPVANRSRSEAEGLIGLFVNTVVLRADLSGRPGFAGLLSRAREVTLAAFAHEEIPFEKLVEELRPEREPGGNPWFQVLFTLQSQPSKLRVGELDLSISEVDTGTARAGLTLIWREREGGLAGTLEHSTDLFERASAERLLGHMAALLRGALADPERDVWELPLLDEAERRQILVDWNRTAAEPPGEAPIHAWFEEQAARAGDRVAIESADERLTYAELNARANQLAHSLRRRGVGPESLVGLSVPRSPEMVVGLLGILKAGGAYLPLDPAFPRERLRAMIEEARPAALVTLDPLRADLPETGGPVVCLDRDREALSRERTDNPASGATADNLVYAMYTSGSTGRPKGVAIPHRGVVRLVRGANFARLDGEQVFLQLAPLAFDASTLEIWGPLANGSRLALAPPGTPSLAELGRALRRHGVTTLWLTAGLFHQAVDEGIGELQGLSQLLAGGDALSVPHVRRALSALPGCALINGYGPTENTTFTCCHRIAPGSLRGASVPIGGPIANTRVYLLDRELRPVPVEVPGELYAGGDGLARGYLGRPDLTAERFVPSPLAGAEDPPGARLYRTGDLARWRPDGAIEFLGRIDQQVKIRGFRIEPGEIEAVLAEHPAVREAAVLAVEDGGERRLVAWVAPGAPEGELKEFLAQRLPAYMVPARFVFLGALPLTPNGKVDRRALPRPVAIAETAGGDRPGTATEEILAGLVASLLGVPSVGIHDDFFALGGHSLLAIRLVARVRELLGVEIELQSVFEAPTVAELAQRLGTAGVAPPIARRSETENPPPLSFAQESLWFLDRLEPGGTAYNVPVPLDLSGPLAPAALAAALSEVERRHEALRTVFATDVQVVRPAQHRLLPVVDLSSLPEDRRRPESGRLSGEEARRPFDLERGPLLRATLLRLDAEEHRLLLTFHHAVVDGWSVDLLLRELAAGAPSPLPEPPLQYGDFAVWQRRWLSGGPLEALLAHWRGRLAGAPDVLALPADRPRPAVRSQRGAVSPLAIEAELAAALTALSRQAGATLFMTLLAAFEALLHRYTGEEDLLVGSPVAGRGRAELQGVVGLFVNTLALRGDLAGDPDFLALLGRTRETALDAYAHQDLPFERLVAELAPERSLGQSALVQVFFLLQNDPALPTELAPGLALRLGPETGGTAKFDLKLALAETAGELAGGFEYAADLFDAVTVERMAVCFRNLLAGIVAAPGARLSELPLLPAGELAQLLAGEAEAPPEMPRLVPERFAEWAARTPDAPAVVGQGRTLTYGELDRRANRLALRLRAAGVGPETLVAIGLERSPDFLVALLAAWKAGGAYLPLDPDLPEERRRALLADSGARALITQEDLDGGESPEGPPPLAGPGNLAYVLYTSGSTGRPKGVMVEHRQLASYVSAVQSRLALPDVARYGMVSTFAADLGNTVVFSALTTGGALHVLSATEALEQHPVDCLKIVPSHLAALLAGERPERVLPRQLLVLGGEALSWTLVDRVRELAPGCRVLNHYGPTETTVGVLTFPTWSANGRGTAGVPLGRPLAGTRAAVRDARLQPVPPGVPGELLVGGPQVSRGYLGRPDLTAERFVPAPGGERMYRTGDLVRRLPGGEILFLGRIDQQVKIRGFRVEPGEIEAVLAEHPAVREAVVLAIEDGGERRLVAWVAAGSPEGELREFLAQRLPAFMVPARFVFLDTLPLTPNGKVDRRALPEPAAAVVAEPAPLRTPTEEILAGLFAEVLATGSVGAEDGFFERGGHSLGAVRLLARARQVFGVEVELRALFERPAVRALAAHVDELRRAGRASEAPPLVARERRGNLPLSFAQERLWFLEQLAPGSAVYNVPRVFRLEGKLSAGAFAAALSEIVRRHEAVRTTFAPVDGTPVQRVAPAVPVPLPLADLSGLSGPVRDPEVRRLAREEAGRPFDLGRGPLLRAFLLRQASESHVAFVTMHHLASDGWSVGVLVHEVSALYGAFAAGQPSPLLELPLQYADFALWQRERLLGETLASELAFWREALAGAPETLALPADRSRPPVPSGRGTTARFRLPEAAADGLRALALRSAATPFMLLLAVFEILLSRLSGQTDLTVGTPVAGRERIEIQNLIGFFVNTLVLRADLADDPAFHDLLVRTRAHVLEAFSHQELPFEKLVQELQPGRNPGSTPLFQVLFVVQSALREPLRLPGLSVEPVLLDDGTAKVDLTLVFSEEEGGFTGELTGSADLFEEETLARWAGGFEHLLTAALEAPAPSVSALPLLSAAERRQLLAEWSGAKTSYPREATVHELFQAQAAAAGDRVALEAGDARLTYAELASRAHRLAWHLRGLGVGPDDRVGLAVEDLVDLVAGMLGILEAGGAYVPLDLSYPQERLDWMAEDAGLAALVHDGSWKGASAAPRVDLDELEAMATDVPVPSAGTTAENLAYVLYTSGSTGRPKGVAVPHRAIVRLLVESDYVRIEPSDRVAQVSNASFDALTFEVWGALLAGARLVGVPREEVLSPEALAQRLAGEGITATFLTTALFNQMVRQAPGAFRGVRHLLFGGEAVDPGAVREVLHQGPPERLLHVYGPTETTTFATWHLVGKPPAPGATVPIGQPIANSTAYVADLHFDLAPPGVPGELLLGGDGLARGYQGRPDLTAERFVPHPWSDRPGDRLYRTGDLVRRVGSGGGIEFLGRIDQQVKIRGFRIEPGEIEAALATHPEVAASAVVVRGSSGEDRRLIAWLAPREGSALTPAGLRAWLAARMPAYMVPSAFGILEALPLNPNSKVDRRALARRELPSAETRGAEPETPFEIRIAAVWSDLLGHERIGRDDDFFALGGHSLLATRVVSRLREELGVELPLVTVFENPTLAGLAAAAGQAAGTAPDDGPIPAAAGSEAPLSFAQERMWFLAQLRPGSATYNVPAAVRLTGALDAARLAACFGEIVRRHETLRTTFPAVEGEPRQQIAPAAPFHLPLIDVSASPGEARRLIAAEAAMPFDLASGPLLRATLLRLGSNEHLLLLTLHHIVADGWSVGLLVREIAAFYAAEALPELPVQYADFALWQRRRLSGALLGNELAFWRERLRGAPPELALPLDHARPPAPSGRAVSAPLRLSGDLVEGVRQLAREAGATPFMVLLAAFEALLSRLSGQTDLTVGTSVAGRQRAEIEGLIGFFVNTLVLRGELEDGPSFDGFLARTRRHALEAFAHQELPFEKLVELLQPGRNLGQTPLFQAFFALQNTPVAPLRLPGLTVEPLPEENATAKFDLILALAEEGDGFTGVLAGSADLLEAATVERWAGCFERLLAAALQNSGERVLELPLLGEAERAQLLAWSAAAWELSPSVRIEELFAEQVARTPDKPAAVCRGESLTYRELAEQAGRLAGRLAGLGEGPVGLMAMPDLPLVVGMLGILRAGRAFVPLDPGLPAERLARMIADCGVETVAADRENLARCPAGPPVVCLDDELATLPPAAAETGDGTAYVIFTSGSTGVPKGVPITHDNLVPLLLWSRDVFGFGEHTRVLQSLSYAFDFGVFEILTTLLFGGTLFLRGDEERSDIEGYVREVRSQLINTLHTTPSFFRAVAASAGSEGLPTVEVLHLGGEALTESLVEEAFRVAPKCRVWNGYGPTEAAVNCALYDVGQAGDWRPRGWASLPIGHPSAANRLYVLDRRLHPVPAGAHGELLVGGPALSRGYLGRPELTAERFLPDPFGEPGGRLYRTGDLVRFHDDGAIEFLRRIDDQVKVRGYRIELEEIEAALAAHPEVGACAVLAVRPEGGEPQLVAFAVPRQGTPEAAELRRFLARTLPDYMVPAAFVFLPELPLNRSGKVDRKALALLPAAGTETRGREPATPLERRIAAVWSDLLGRPWIGRDDNFFALGGHSLLATRVVARLRQELGVELPVTVLFEVSTLADLATVVKALLEEAGAGVDEPIPAAEGTEEAPLSFAQERLWFLEQLHPGRATYNLPAAVRLTGALDPAALAGACREIVRRHETLRSAFPEAGGVPRLEIAPGAGIDLSRVDLSARPEEARRLIEEEAVAPFDLAAGPLLRTTLLRLGANEHLLLLTMHHIVSDGWSIGLLVREIAALYETFAAGRPSPLPELPIQYTDFARWQRRRLSGAALECELRFWSERLEGAPAELALPADRPRPAAPSECGVSCRLRLDSGMAGRVRALALASGATPFMVLLAAFETLLSRLSGQTDLTVGTPVAGRQHAQVEGLIGLFVNTLVLRADLGDAPSFAGLLDRTRRHALSAYAHPELPFEKLVEHLQPRRDLRYTPLFQATFALQNAPAEALRLPGLAVELLASETNIAKFDLSLALGEEGDGFSGKLIGSADLFEAATVERWAGSFERLLEAALAAPGESVLDLPLLSEAERAQLLTWSAAAWEIPAPVRIEELFLDQVDRTPDKTAVACQGRSLTYRQLAERAGRLAGRLAGLGEGPVGLMAGPDLPLVAGMLGILRAGRAFVPLDPGLPAERLARMIADCGVEAIAADRESLARCPAVAHRVCLDDEPGPPPPSNPGLGDGTAYVIFTSGSTGVPKGVPITHDNLVPLLLWSRSVFGFGEHTRVLQSLSYAFDFGVFEILTTLLFGGTLFLRGDEERSDIEGYVREVRSQSVNTLHTTPSFFRAVAASAGVEGLPTVEVLHLGGEALTESLVEEAFRVAPECRVWNGYGPTEAAVNCALYDVGRAAGWRPRGWASLPIGHPSAANRLYVLDRRLHPVPAGAHGELLVGGPALSRGYLGRPELTAERFLPDPFGEPGGRLYRTGDLVRFHDDGAIEFLRRIDDQVKVRGYRIELEEIEAALAAHPEVGACAVLAVLPEGGEPQLVAFAVPRQETPEAAELRRFLARTLPDYMVPTAFVFLPELPLNRSGKVDRKALALLPVAGAETRGSEPATPLERRIAAVWSDLLGRPWIGRDDNFFALGGHSLLATRVAARLRQELSVELPVTVLFEAPVLADLATVVEALLPWDPAAVQPAAPPLRRVERCGPLPLSFAQERLWFLEQLEPGSAFYNIPLASRLSGPLAIDALRQGIAALVDRHESLRTTFGDEQGRPFQVVADSGSTLVPLVDLSGLPGPWRDAELRRLVAQETRRPFDLSRGPLFRVPLFRLGPEEHALVPTMHHIISDGWSMTVLLREIAALYGAFSAGRTPDLPELPVQYADYAVWQRGYLQGEELKARLAWWRERLTGAPGLQLPLDRPRPPVETFRGRARRVALSPGLTRRLHELANREGVTLFMALLAVFQTLLLRVTGQTDLPVGSPIANRYRSELEDVIGFFANTLVLRTDLSGNPSFRELLSRVREVTLGAYAHEDVPFEKLVEEIQPERDMSRNPLFQVMCVLQNQPWPEAPMGEVRISPLPVDSGTAKFDLTLFWREDQGVLFGLLEHNTDLFDDTTAERLYRHHEALLKAALDDPEARIGALPLLDASLRHQILREWNRAAGDGAWAGRAVHQQVEEQAVRTPGVLAVIDGDRTLTYAELDARANRLARGLARRGVRPEALVGICVERSLEMVVATLAVLKAGGALVALDPAYPRERLAAIIDDARLAVLLTQASLLANFPEHQGIAFCLERGDDPFPEESEESLRVPVEPDHPVYAIYTSGSTGQPKGIVVTHRAFSNLLAWQLGDPGLKPGGRTVQFATFGFCVSFQEMLSSWSSGGTLVIADEMTRRDLPGLARFLEESAIDRLHLPFAALKHLAEAATGQRLPARLRTVITAGEQLQVTPAVRSLFERLPGCTLANQYGASETHVVTALTLSGDPAGWPAIPPVGRPVDRVSIHLLDAGMEPVPIGVAGELYAGGACTPRCYLNDPVLTAAKLVPDPFGGVPGARLYRTGDAARYLPDGRIEYHGRIDTQVKIRGFRVELGEIETVLARHPGVRDAAVVARPGHDGPRLVAYVVPAGESVSVFDELRTHLKQKLPEHMLPSVFVEMPALPVNANGKLDQAALPEPEIGKTREQKYVAPRTPIEELIAGIWAEVLGLPRVGVASDFFELGGHSLLATQVVARIRQTLGVDLSVRALFEARTVEELTLAVAESLLDQADAEDALEALAAAEGEPGRLASV